MTPELGKEMELTERNWRAWNFYNQAKATGLTDEEKRDPIVRRIFAIVSRLTEAADRQAQAAMMACEVANLFNRNQQR